MSILSSIRRHLVVAIAAILAALVIAIIAGRAISAKPSAVAASNAGQVTLVNAATFRQGNLTVPAAGVVESHSQADLKSQVSAPVASIDVAIGDSVYPGETILELDNADLRAQVAQAEAALAVVGGQSETGAISLDSAKQGVLNALTDAYAKTYSAIISQAEQILYNDDGHGGRLTSTSIDNSLNSEITSTDFDLRTDLTDWKSADDALTSATSTGALDSAVSLARMAMSSADLLLDDMSKEVNALTVSAQPGFMATLAGWQATISGSQSSVSGAEQALIGADQSLNTAESSQSSTVPAQVSAAQANVNNLEAQLKKTIITSPTYGTVSALPLHVGELASPGTLLASVVGSGGGLIVKAYVSGTDLSRVKAGASANIQDQASRAAVLSPSSTPTSIDGVVSNVAPGVDETTREAEVDIDIVNPVNSGLVIGDQVTATITATNSLPSAGSISSAQAPTTYILPIQDVKIVPNASYVLTVSSSSKVVFDPVTVGMVSGGFIEVTGGLRDDMDIVSPVYGLDEGQTVVVQP